MDEVKPIRDMHLRIDDFRVPAGLNGSQMTRRITIQAEVQKALMPLLEQFKDAKFHEHEVTEGLLAVLEGVYKNKEPEYKQTTHFRVGDMVTNAKSVYPGRIGDATGIVTGVETEVEFSYEVTWTSNQPQTKEVHTPNELKIISESIL